MGRLRKFFCRHNVVRLTRIDQNECKELYGKEAWKDIHEGYNFITCCKCGKTLEYKRYVYTMILPELEN